MGWNNKIAGTKGVLVLGMHRTGTSALTRGLAALGVEIGDKLMPAQKGDNEKGFFEDLDVYNLNHNALLSAGADWDSLRVELTEDKIEEYSREAAKLIKRKFAGKPMWGFKDPRTVRLMPIWDRALESLEVETLFVVSNRNPKAVAGSLAKRNKMPKSKALGLWLLHSMDALNRLKGRGGIVVDYERMLSEPREQMERLCVFLGVDPASRVKAIEEYASEFLDSSLNHNKAEAQEEGQDDLEVVQLSKDVYAYLSELGAKGPEDQAVDPERVEQYSQRLEKWISNNMPWIDLSDDMGARSRALEQLAMETQRALSLALYEDGGALKDFSGKLTVLEDNIGKLTDEINELRGLDEDETGGEGRPATFKERTRIMLTKALVPMQERMDGIGTTLHATQEIIQCQQRELNQTREMIEKLAAELGKLEFEHKLHSAKTHADIQRLKKGWSYKVRRFFKLKLGIGKW